MIPSTRNRAVFAFLLALGFALFLNGFLLYNIKYETAIVLEIWVGLGLLIISILYWKFGQLG